MVRRPVLWGFLLIGLLGLSVHAQELRRWGGVYYQGASDNNEIQALSPIANGGFTFAGWVGPTGAEDFWLGELDGGGNRVWAYPYGGPGEDICADMVSTADGGWVMVGHTRSFGAGEEDVLVVKVRADRTVDWARTFGGAYRDVAKAVRQTADGGYVVVGYTDSFTSGYGDGWLLRVGSTGSLLWYRSYGGYDHVDRFQGVALSPEGDFVVAGFACSSPGPGQEQFWVMKISNQTDHWGEILWERRYNWNSAAYAVQTTADGGYIVAGRMLTGVDEDFFLVRLASDGSVTWQRTFGGEENEVAYGVVQTSDSGFVAVGFTSSFGVEGSYDGWAIKTDSSGILQWQRYTRRPGDDVLYDVAALPDGYLGMGGETNQDGASVQEAWGSRTTSEGVVFGCAHEGATAGAQEADTTTTYSWTPSINFGSVQSGDAAVTRGTSTFNGGPICEIEGPFLALESHWISDDNNDDGILDPGETITLGLTVRNTGISGVTGVTCSLFSANTWVSVTQPDSDFPDMAVGATGANGTDFQFFLGPGVACGDTVPIVFTFRDGGGSIIPSACNLTFTVGTAPPAVTLLNEDFASGIPPAWTVVDGGDSTFTWRGDDPCSRNLFATPYAIADTWCAGYFTMEEQLLTPALDCSAMSGVTLSFSNHYRSWGDTADVDVRSTLTGGEWTNVAKWTADDSGARSFDITAQAAGASDVQVRWHFYDAYYGYYWGIDDVLVEGQPAAVCHPKPVLPTEVCGSGTTSPLRFTSKTALAWEDKSISGADSFNLYRGTRTHLTAGNYGTCFASGLTSSAGSEPDDPVAGAFWFYVVSGENTVGEGPLGYASGASSPTPPASYCP